MLNATKQDGWSPLHLAAGNSHIEIVQLLLERGAKAEIRNEDGRTAFDEALRIGELKIAELLSQYGGRGV
jgi:ankyrin repeat protein